MKLSLLGLSIVKLMGKNFRGDGLKCHVHACKRWILNETERETLGNQGNLQASVRDFLRGGVRIIVAVKTNQMKD